MTQTIGQTIFWACLGGMAYVYVGYPILVWVVGQLAQKKVNAGPFEPNVTVLITAFNEAASIRGKIENTLDLNYPAEKLEVLVASDGSTDATDEIVGEFANRGVRLFRQDGRVGKTITQNNAVRQARGEIILFSDATTMYRDRLRRRTACLRRRDKFERRQRGAQLLELRDIP
jgi:cellulose synthase/poly-beta-1,6-N-acetylglucosamine synthase-like glycosyltransferase